MPVQEPFVIVGGSLAGAKAAETLRKEGFGGPVVLVGAEAETPYERPPLSKGYLLGTADRESPRVHPADWYPENGSRWCSQSDWIGMSVARTSSL